MDKSFNYDEYRNNLDASRFTDLFGGFDQFKTRLEKNKEVLLARRSEVIVPIKQGTKEYLLTILIDKIKIVGIDHDPQDHPMMEPIRELLLDAEFITLLESTIIPMVETFKEEKITIN